ncbi:MULTISPECIES: hypothetical protein [Bacillales]|uniref:hypothetical protein n=1 Tax=Bacillales TaxID=1385 RepID=UPI0024B353AC|nr:hypothetical protein [Pseudalkalibacillus hwajinpoensis]
MTTQTKVEDFKELFDLIIYYSENRDRPVDKGFNFFEHVEFHCNNLGLDYEEFKKTFDLKQLF